MRLAHLQAEFRLSKTITPLSAHTNEVVEAAQGGYLGAVPLGASSFLKLKLSNLLQSR